MLLDNRRRPFIDHSFCVRISYYCNNVEYIKWNFFIVTVTISLNNIMDNGDEHTYLPGYVPIDPNQLNTMKNMF